MEIKYRCWDNWQGGKFEYWNSKKDENNDVFWSMIRHRSFEQPNLCTGFKDKDGKDIYEGDIISDITICDEGPIKSKNQVYFCQNKGAWMVDHTMLQNKEYGYPLCDELKSFDYEVTDHIYSNKNKSHGTNI